MSGEQPRTDANSRDRSPDHQYSLSIEQTAELYAQAGHSRTIRAVQKYCALSKLDCHKVDTDTGEKYLVAPYSVTRHIAYINEVRTVATGRDQSRTDANVRPLENKDEAPREGAANKHEQPRTDAAVRGCLAFTACRKLKQRSARYRIRRLISAWEYLGISAWEYLGT
jgi:hypothetical protein